MARILHTRACPGPNPDCQAHASESPALLSRMPVQAVETDIKDAEKGDQDSVSEEDVSPAPSRLACSSPTWEFNEDPQHSTWLTKVHPF